MASLVWSEVPSGGKKYILRFILISVNMAC